MDDDAEIIINAVNSNAPDSELVILINKMIENV